MKLKNLLFATMFACAFASCSSDDDPVIDNGGGNEAADATFSIKVAEPVATKADVAPDAKITSLTVFVYNGQKLETSGSATNQDGVLEVREIKVSAGQKSIVVVANTTVKEEDAGTLTKLYAATKGYSGEVDGTLSMNSKTYVVNIQPGVTNYLGYTKPANDNTNAYLDQNPVKLYRNVAKVNLASLKVNTEGATNIYPNAKLKVTNIYILHGAAKTKIVGGADEWNATAVTDGWLNGATNSDYEKWVGIIQTWEEKDPSNNAIKQYLENGYTENNMLKATDLTAVTNLEDKAAAVNNVCNFYTFENLNPDGIDNVHTLLVVEGDFSYGGGEFGNKVSSKRYYSVSVGHDFVQDGKNGHLGDLEREDEGVLRNLQYNIDLTVKGPGYTTPFGPKSDEDTFLDVQVEVVAFGFVNQKVDIE